MKKLLLCLTLCLSAALPAAPSGPGWLQSPASADFSFSIRWDQVEDPTALSLLLGNLSAALKTDALLEDLDLSDDQLVRTDAMSLAGQRRVEASYGGSKPPKVWGSDELSRQIDRARRGRAPRLGSLSSIRSLVAGSESGALGGWMGPGSLGLDAGGPDWALGGVVSRLPGIAVRATAEADPEFSMWTEAATEPDALFLAAELRNFFGGGGNAAIARIRDSLRVNVEGRKVTAALQLSREGLQQLKGSQAATRFLRWELSIPRERRIRIAELFDLLGARPGARIADVGAGGGFATVRLARAVGPEGRVAAVDIDARALSRLRDRVTFQQLHNVDVVEGETDDPGLAAGSLDGVFITNAYHEMTEYPSMLAHIRKALRPGGRLVILEPYDPAKAGRPREEQVKDHHISGDLIKRDLIEAGYRVLVHDDEFVVDSSMDHDHREVLLVAVAGAESGSTGR